MTLLTYIFDLGDMTNVGGFSVGSIGGETGFGGLGGCSGNSGNSSTCDEPFSNLSRLGLFFVTNCVCLAASSIFLCSSSFFAFFSASTSFAFPLPLLLFQVLLLSHPPVLPLPF